MSGNRKSQSTRILDVRPLLQRSDPPFPHVLETVDNLDPGQDLVIIAPFQPFPLYIELGKRGYEYSASIHDDGDWDIRFTPAR